MSGGLSFGTLVKKQFTASKLIFHFADGYVGLAVRWRYVTVCDLLHVKALIEDFLGILMLQGRNGSLGPAWRT